MSDRKDDLIIDELRCSLNEHIESQKKYEESQKKTMESLLEHNEYFRNFIERADPVVTSFTNIVTAGDLLSKSVIWISKMLLSLGAIIGVIYAIKEWIKK